MISFRTCPLATCTVARDSSSGIPGSFIRDKQSNCLSGSRANSSCIVDMMWSNVSLYDDWNDFNVSWRDNQSTCIIPLTAPTAGEVAAALFKALGMAVVIVAAVCGNVLVIVSALRFERLRIIANSFLVSLAVADLLVAVLVMPFNALQQIAERWPFGPVVCDLFNANDVLFSTASLLHLCCVSVDRYVAVTDPFGYERRMTLRRVVAMLVCLWTASALLGHLPIHLDWYLDGSEPLPDDCNEVCEFNVNKVYGIVSCAISFWFPAIIMVVAYFRIFRAAQRQAKFIQSLSLSTGSSIDRLDLSTAAAGNGSVVSSTTARNMRVADGPAQPPRPERRKMRREHKAAKTLGVIMGAFLCCWLPFFTWYIYDAMCGEMCPETPPVVVSVLFWIGYVNSALNPLIYALFNRDFRHAFQRTLAACRCCRRQTVDEVAGCQQLDVAGEPRGRRSRTTGNTPPLTSRRMVVSVTEETCIR